MRLMATNLAMIPAGSKIEMSLSLNQSQKQIIREHNF
jgi:hypothetical protein